MKSFSNDNNDDSVNININNKIEGPVKDTIYPESRTLVTPQQEMSTPSLPSTTFTPSPETMEPVPQELPTTPTTPITDRNIKQAVNDWVNNPTQATTKYG